MRTLGCLLLLIPQLSIAQNLITLTDSENEIDITNKIEVAKISATEFDSKDWRLPNIFDMNFDGKIRQGYTADALFMRFHIFNSSNKKISIILFLDHILTGEVEFFDGVSTQVSGSSKISSSRVVDSIFTAFNLSLDANETKTFYMRKKSGHLFNTRVLVTSKQNFKLMEVNKFNVFRFYAGAILALLFYNLLLAAFLKDTNYYFYSAFVFSLFVTVLVMQGILDFIPFLNNRTISSYLIFFSSISLIFAILFTKKILPSQSEFPTFDRVFKYQLYFTGVLPIVSFLPFYSQVIWFFGPYIDFLILFSMLTMTSYGFIRALKKESLAIIYTISWLCIFFGIIIYYLSLYGLLDKNWFTRNSIIVGNVLQMLTLSLGLGYKVITIGREKDEALVRASSKEKYQKLLRVLSHDVSNSLQVIQLSLKRLARGLRQDQNVTKLNRILTVAENMRAILDNVKKEQKLELDKETIQLSKIELIGCIKKSLLVFEDKLNDKNITINQAYVHDEVFITAEQVSLINNVLSNIFSNSIKFSPKGGVIGIKVMQEGDSFHLLITDEGAGFSSNLISNFENDGKIESTMGTDGEEGTGFGMKIIKSYVEIYNGRIELKNNNGAEYHLFFKAV